jgi:uncharacterized protein YecE (DUF72 family)
MITIGCAGFPVPATTYFKEFLFGEIQETHLGAPSMGNLRRWRREAAPSFRFSLLAPKDVGLSGFVEDEASTKALEAFFVVGAELKAEMAVFPTPPEFAENKANKALIKKFLARMQGKFPTVVWDPPASWDADDAAALAKEAGAIATRDPLVHGTTKDAFAYYRLPGPAGFKSRYEDASMERLTATVSAAKNKDAIYVFTNVDMYPDAKRLRKALGL